MCVILFFFEDVKDFISLLDAECSVNICDAIFGENVVIFAVKLHGSLRRVLFEALSKFKSVIAFHVVWGHCELSLVRLVAIIRAESANKFD